MDLKPSWREVVELAVASLTDRERFSDASREIFVGQLRELADYLDYQLSTGFDGLLIEPGHVGVEA